MYRWLVGNLRLWSVLELVSSLFAKNCESIHDEQGTTNREIVAKHLDMGILAYVLSSRKSTHENHPKITLHFPADRLLAKQGAGQAGANPHSHLHDHIF